MEGPKGGGGFSGGGFGAHNLNPGPSGGSGGSSFSPAGIMSSNASTAGGGGGGSFTGGGGTPGLDFKNAVKGFLGRRLDRIMSGKLNPPRAAGSEVVGRDGVTGSMGKPVWNKVSSQYQRQIEKNAFIMDPVPTMIRAPASVHRR